MSYYEEQGVWRHVCFATMLDRRQAIMLLDYLRTMEIEDYPSRVQQAVWLQSAERKLAGYWAGYES